jgi:multisubunit Na+/H+ antiporter MnhB subunit
MAGFLLFDRERRLRFYGEGGVMFAIGVVLFLLFLIIAQLFGRDEPPYPVMVVGVLSFVGGLGLILISLCVWLYRVVPLP